MKPSTDVGTFLRQFCTKGVAAVVMTNALTGLLYGSEFLSGGGEPLSGAILSEVSVRGEIVPSDVKALAAFLQSAQRVITMTVDSSGGDVVEPIRMGEIVRASALRTKVAPRGQCSCACLFGWMAGSTRIAISAANNVHLGGVGSHRHDVMSDTAIAIATVHH
jgi:hypothetical protein